MRLEESQYGSGALYVCFCCQLHVSLLLSSIQYVHVTMAWVFGWTFLCDICVSYMINI